MYIIPGRLYYTR